MQTYICQIMDNQKPDNVDTQRLVKMRQINEMEQFKFWIIVY